MHDRVPLYPGRVTLTPVAGQENTFDMALADAPQVDGTPLNKANLLTDESAARFGLDNTAVVNDMWGRIVLPEVNITTSPGASVTAKQYARSASKLGDAEIGATVKLNVDGVPTEFLVVHKGKPSSIYDDSFNNGVILLMKDLYESRQWHSSNVNDYANSTIHSYLNSTFLALFDSDIQSQIVQVKVPYRPGSGTSKTCNTGANGLSAKIFLLSDYEVGWTTSTNQYMVEDGACLSYFSGTAATNANRIGYLNGTATSWWLRSPYTSNAASAWRVDSDGNCSNVGCSGSSGVRPALVLPSTLLVSDDGFIDDAPPEVIASVGPVIAGENGVATLVLPDYGDWVMEAELGEDTKSDILSVTEVKQYNLALGFVNIYGVSWDGSSTTKWSRTDDAAGFTDPVPAIGSGSGSSPFDDLLPWSGMERVTDSEAGEMVKIPKFWYKITQSGNGLTIQIADKATTGFSVSPAHMDRGDGSGERDYVLIGRYHCASDYKSKAGVTPYNNQTRATFRTGISNLGSKVWMADWAMRFTLFLLYLVEFADWNTQAKIGYGCGNNSGVQNMGYTDSMKYHTGTTQSSRTTYGLGTQYRWIEGLWDNVRDWIDGCYNSSSGLMLILNPASGSDSSGGVSVGTPSNGYPSKFALKNVSGTFPLFIPTEAPGSDSTYSCDLWYFGASSPCVCVGGDYGQGTSCGLFYFGHSSAASKGASIGSRSMKLP